MPNTCLHYLHFGMTENARLESRRTLDDAGTLLVETGENLSNTEIVFVPDG